MSTVNGTLTTSDSPVFEDILVKLDLAIWERERTVNDDEVTKNTSSLHESNFF